MKWYIATGVVLGALTLTSARDMSSVYYARRHGAEAKAVVTVVHEDGSPVVGAEVRGTFPEVDTRNAKYFRRVNVHTDVNGQATLQSVCGGAAFMAVRKEGYYPSREVIRFDRNEPSCLKDGR